MPASSIELARQRLAKLPKGVFTPHALFHFTLPENFEEILRDGVFSHEFKARLTRRRGNQQALRPSHSSLAAAAYLDPALISVFDFWMQKRLGLRGKFVIGTLPHSVFSDSVEAFFPHVASDVPRAVMSFDGYVCGDLSEDERRFIDGIRSEIAPRKREIYALVRRQWPTFFNGRGRANPRANVLKELNNFESRNNPAFIIDPATPRADLPGLVAFENFAERRIKPDQILGAVLPAKSKGFLVRCVELGVPVYDSSGKLLWPLKK